MEKNREKRYQGVEELLSEFTNIEKGIPTTERVIPERKPSTSREITVKLGLKKLLIPALVLLVLVIAAVIVLRFIPQSKFSATSLPPEITAEKEDYFMTGNKYWKSKNYPEAIIQFRKILDMGPKNLEAQLSLADILKEQGKINEAIPEYEKVIALNNLDPRPYNRLGEIFEEKQELEKAVHYYRKYLNTTPKSPNFKIINQKIEDLEVQLQPLDEEEKQIVEPLEIEKVDLSTKLDLGIKAFNQGDFNQCIKQMEEILKLEPKNNTAQYFLAEAKKRKGEKLKEQEIRNRLKIAQDAYQKGDYQECINQTKRILRLDPDNAQAIKYSNLANLKIAPEQIKAIVSQFIKSINNKDLLAFYKKTCSSQLYQELKKDTELILNEYDNLASVSSNISIRFEGLDKAEVNFSNIMTGVSRKDGIKQVLFEGIFKWDMEKQGDNWKIIDISSTYAEKK
jgi:tetratricopeptide (TPR) repeat protein